MKNLYSVYFLLLSKLTLGDTELGSSLPFGESVSGGDNLISLNPAAF